MKLFKEVTCLFVFLIFFLSGCSDKESDKFDDDFQSNSGLDENQADEIAFSDDDFVNDANDEKDPENDSDPFEEEDDSEPFIPVAVCGNDKVEGSEVCDGGHIECQVLGYSSGLAYCKDDCSGWDTDECTVSSPCVENSVKCDGNAVVRCVGGKFDKVLDCSSNFQKCRGGVCVNNSDSRLDFEGPVFSGDKVLVYHYSVNGDAINSTGTLSQFTTLSDHETSYNAPYLLRTDLRPPSPRELNLPPVPAKLHEPLKSFSVGDKDTFYLYNFGTGGTITTTATLRRVGTHCEIWVEDGGASVTDAKINSILSEFDNVIYDLVTENFYSASDVDGNGLVSILLANLGGGVAGYVTMADFYTKQQYSQSNFRDLLYIEKSMDTNSTMSTVVHEFQHLVHANRNFLVEKDYYSGDLDYRWIDEGLAQAAEHMYGGAQTDMLYVLNNSSYNSYTRDGNSFLFWDYYDGYKVYSDYAMSYVFFQYLRIQSGFNTSIYREIIECTTNDYRCVENVVKKYVDPDYSLSDFIVDFRIALVLQDQLGPYSFGGEKAFKFTIPNFTGSSVNLRGGGGITINSSGSFTRPSNAGNNIIFVGINTK